MFWKKFYIKNLLPPVKVVVDNGELIEHKSFNTQYLIWLFAQEGTTELFKLFTQKELDNVIDNFVSEYHLNKYKEPNIIEKLKQYITFIPEIYDSYNSGEKKVILEETKEIFDTNEFIQNVKSEIKDLPNDLCFIWFYCKLSIYAYVPIRHRSTRPFAVPDFLQSAGHKLICDILTFYFSHSR